MTHVVSIRDDDTPELATHRKADPEFYCYELKVGSVLHRKRRDGELREFRVTGFRKGERSDRVAKHNRRVHPKDSVILKEIGTRGVYKEVNAWFIETNIRWGLLR
jgi:hypothetical protein